MSRPTCESEPSVFARTVRSPTNCQRQGRDDRSLCACVLTTAHYTKHSSLAMRSTPLVRVDRIVLGPESTPCRSGFRLGRRIFRCLVEMAVMPGVAAPHHRKIDVVRPIVDYAKDAPVLIVLSVFDTHVLAEHPSFQNRRRLLAPRLILLRCVADTSVSMNCGEGSDSTVTPIAITGKIASIAAKHMLDTISVFISYYLYRLRLRQSYGLIGFGCDHSPRLAARASASAAAYSGVLSK